MACLTQSRLRDFVRAYRNDITAYIAQRYGVTVTNDNERMQFCENDERLYILAIRHIANV